MRIKFYLPLLLSCIVMTGCQTVSDKTSAEVAEPSLEAEIDTQNWLKLQRLTEESLINREFGLAQVNIEKLFKLAAQDAERWDYVRSAIISLPLDIASPLIQSLQGIVNNNKDPEQYYGLSKVYMHYQNYASAIESISQAIQLSDKPSYYFWRARIYAITDKPEQAEKDFQWLLSNFPDEAEYQVQYASFLHQQRQYEQSQKLLEKQAPSFMNTYKRIIFALQAKNQVLAESLYLKLRKSEYDASNDDQYYQLSEVATWLDKPDDSIALLEQVKSGNTFYEARLLLSRLLLEKGKTDRALVILKQIQSASADYAITAYLIESSVYQQSNEYEKAKQVMNQGLMLFKDNPDLLYTRAMIAVQQDDVQAMEKDLKRIIETEPDNAEAYNALGYSLADRNVRLEEAQQYITKAYELKPDSVAIIDSMAWVYYRMGDLENAEKFIRMVIDKGEEDIEIYQHFIEILTAINKIKEADEFRKKAQKIFPDAEFN